MMLLVDELWMMRESLERLLSTTSDCEEVLPASTLGEARSLAKDYQEIDLAIIDPCVEKANWLDDLSSLLEHASLFRAIALSSMDVYGYPPDCNG